jgi:thioredoxin reductase (NADPH)
MVPELMSKFREQAEHFGAELVTDDVTRVDFSERPFRVWVGHEEHRADAVIVATGATARQLGLESETALQGRGVSYCAVCDAAFYPSKRVIVVGGGDSAFEEARVLAKFAREVVIIHRRADFRASQIMQGYAEAAGVKLLTPYVVVEAIEGEGGKLVGVRVRNVETGEEHVEEADGMFVAIGHEPNTSLFLDELDHDEAGYLITRNGSTATNVDGVFAAGDVQDHVYRQAVTAAGSGCEAALDAERWLAHRKGPLAELIAESPEAHW